MKEEEERVEETVRQREKEGGREAERVENVSLLMVGPLSTRFVRRECYRCAGAWDRITR